ncbi:hypothetical protein J6590_041317 [Homalodisca vitripennis]|nr:hypothetical protein J6590_041317 [Homalodisca vitripennis]
MSQIVQLFQHQIMLDDLGSDMRENTSTNGRWPADRINRAHQFSSSERHWLNILLQRLEIPSVLRSTVYRNDFYAHVTIVRTIQIV